MGVEFYGRAGHELACGSPVDRVSWTAVEAYELYPRFQY